MRMNDSKTPPRAWDAVDEALARIRACRGMPEFVDRASELVLLGCRAEAVSIGLIVDGVWSSWLSAGRLEFLQAAGALPSLPMHVDDASDWEQSVMCSRHAGSRELEPAEDGRCVFLTTVMAGNDALGLLHVVAEANVLPQIVQCCAMPPCSLSRRR